MKRLQLLLLSAFLCCAAFSQSANDHIGRINITSPESNIAFSLFTVNTLNGQAILRWAAPTVKAEDFFVIEKSIDAIHFDVISAMEASAGSDSVYSVTDNAVGS